MKSETGAALADSSAAGVAGDVAALAGRDTRQDTSDNIVIACPALRRILDVKQFMIPLSRF